MVKPNSSIYLLITTTVNSHNSLSLRRLRVLSVSYPKMILSVIGQEYLVLLHFNVSLHMSIVMVFVKNKVDLGTPHWAFTNKEGSWVFSN